MTTECVIHPVFRFAEGDLKFWRKLRAWLSYPLRLLERFPTASRTGPQALRVPAGWSHGPFLGSAPRWALRQPLAYTCDFGQHGPIGTQSRQNSQVDNSLWGRLKTQLSGMGMTSATVPDSPGGFLAALTSARRCPPFLWQGRQLHWLGYAPQCLRNPRLSQA